MVIDAYGHIGSPRFANAEEFVQQMDQHDVSHALLSNSEFCPDVLELGRAAALYPERIRVLATALAAGTRPAESVLQEQMEAGFAGVRVTGEEVERNPHLLDVIGRAKGIVLVIAFEPWIRWAKGFHEFLERYPDSLLIGGHFAGPCDPAVLDANQDMQHLFEHPRFAVVFSRDAMMDPRLLTQWVRALARRMGWDRIMWGSEWPVCMWRDETYADTMRFVRTLGLSFSEEHAVMGGNAARLIFQRPLKGIDPRALRDLMPHKVESTVPFLPHGLQLPEVQHLRLLRAHRALTEPQPYSTFVRELLDRGLDSVASNRKGQ